MPSTPIASSGHESDRIPVDGFEVEVFRTGDFGDKGTYTIEDLDHLAESYDPGFSEAPVTLDHQQAGPSHGWVGTLRRRGEKLIAGLRSLSPSLRQLIAGGAYKKRSVELYRDFQGKGKPYLKALSFLGAASPEVRGLEDPVFSDPAGVVVRFDMAPQPAEAEPVPAEQPMEAFDGRQQLIDSRVWNPLWEAMDFQSFFEELTDNRMREKFLRFLKSPSTSVSFGKTGFSTPSPDDSVSRFNGAISEESLEQHQRALAFQSKEPALSYVDALLRATSSSS